MSSAFSENHGDVVESGTVTSTIQWFLYEDGFLDIIGVGSIPDYLINDPPWKTYKEQIVSLRISNGITSIGSYVFSSYGNLAKAELPNSITFIGTQAFSDCTQLKLTKLPSSLEEIGRWAFRSCELITIQHFPESLKNIQQNGFLACTGLNILYFHSIPTSLANNTFTRCANITDIYVPWKSGAVANAPWGAPSTATIHYEWTPN